MFRIAPREKKQDERGGRRAHYSSALDDDEYRSTTSKSPPSINNLMMAVKDAAMNEFTLLLPSFGDSAREAMNLHSCISSRTRQNSDGDERVSECI